MAKLSILFHTLIQDSQDLGSDDDHMVSRVIFNLYFNGVLHKDLHADIKQPVGSNIEKDPLEVSAPVGYAGPFNYHEFQTAVENYFRGLVGSSGSGIRIVNSSNIRMRNNRFSKPQQVDFEVSEDAGSW